MGMIEWKVGVGTTFFFELRVLFNVLAGSRQALG